MVKQIIYDKNGIKAANGFEALKEYDENKEEVNGEARETTLGCTNHDGITDTGELHTLTELGVASIEEYKSKKKAA